LTNALSVAAMYGSKKKGVYLAAAYNVFDKYLNNYLDAAKNKSSSELRLSAQYAEGGLIANAIYQNFDKNVAKGLGGNNIQVGLGYKMGKMMPKFKYSMVDYEDKTKKDGSAIAVGVDYAFAKKTTGVVEYVSLDKNISGTSKSKNTLSIGVNHKF
jgi:predicted porin